MQPTQRRPPFIGVLLLVIATSILLLSTDRLMRLLSNSLLTGKAFDIGDMEIDGFLKVRVHGTVLSPTGALLAGVPIEIHGIRMSALPPEHPGANPNSFPAGPLITDGSGRFSEVCIVKYYASYTNGELVALRAIAAAQVEGITASVVHARLDETLFRPDMLPASKVVHLPPIILDQENMAEIRRGALQHLNDGT